MVCLRNIINISLSFSGLFELGSTALVGLRGRQNLYPDANKNVEVTKFDLTQFQDTKFTEDKSCCIICPNGLTKYYSVSTIFGNCGETCLDPNDYDIYKIFEPGLSIATTNNICEDLGYSLYIKTEKHGVWPIQINVDMYKKSYHSYYESGGDCPALTVTCEYLPGVFQCCPSGESCIPNVGCRC